MPTSRTAFRPGEHGFPWPNDFDGDEIVASWFDQGLMTKRSASDILGLVHGGPARRLTAEMLDITGDEVAGEMARLVHSTGLSAGMCLEALGRYQDDLTPWKSKPGRKSRRYADLTRRQFLVFGRWGRLGELLQDMGRPDVSHPWERAKSMGRVSFESLPRIRARLERGEPVPVVLYRARWNPFAHDVVLAYGYSESRARSGRLDFYDPNHPAVEAFLTIDLERENNFLLEPKSVYGLADRKIRGFKPVRYNDHGTDEADRALPAVLAAL